MTGTDLAHAQQVLRSLRDEVDERLSSVVRSTYKGEDVAESLFGTPVSDPSLDAIRCWPETGWPDQLRETQ